MGWWKVDEKIELGDGPLDIAGDLLGQIAQEYIDDLGRKPTLAEMVRILEEGLRNEAETCCEDGERLSFSITFKTKPRPKKQSIRVGDIFAVPLPNNMYGFGYVTPQDLFVEFFLLCSTKIPSLEYFRDAERFRPRFMISMDAVRSREWKIVRYLPFENADSYPLQQFLMGVKVTCGNQSSNGFIDVSSESRPATDEELLGLPKLSIANEKYVIEYLEKIFDRHNVKNE
jgi:hypothetical protein